MSDPVSFAVHHDGYDWVAELQGGGVTQAANMDKLRARCVEVVKLMLDRDVTVDDIAFDISVTIPGVEPDAAHEIAAMRAELDELTQRLSKRTEDTVKSMAKRGFPMRDISQVVGVSHQRVGQILAAEGVAEARATRIRKAKVIPTGSHVPRTRGGRFVGSSAAKTSKRAKRS